MSVRSPKFRKLWIGLGVLVLLSPLGLILPRLFRAGGAWGEWGTDELREIVGYVPEGMKRLSEMWSAPLSDYAFSGWDKGAKAWIAYLISAIVGVAVVGVVAYILGKIFKRGE